MKKNLFFFAMLANVAASAQSMVQIMPISATYTSTPTIQFEVSWTSQTTTDHRNKVWVFVDFQPVISPTQKGNWQPATITGTVQRTSGTISEQSNRGFFLEGTTTNFSSTITVTLTNINTAQFNWCAYGSDYPPNAEKQSDGTYKLRGTPPFIVTTSSGTTEVNNKSFPGTNCITAITDKTGCPGIPFGAAGHPSGSQGCCSGSILVGGQCYNANFSTCSVVTITEIATTNITGKTWATRNACVSGWRIPSYVEWKCIAALSLPESILPFYAQYFTSTTTGYDGSCLATDSTYWWYVFLYETNAKYCSLNYGDCSDRKLCRIGWYSDANSGGPLVKCIR